MRPAINSSRATIDMRAGVRWLLARQFRYKLHEDGK